MTQIARGRLYRWQENVLAQGKAAEGADEALQPLRDEVNAFSKGLNHLGVALAGAEDAVRILPRLKQMYCGGP